MKGVIMFRGRLFGIILLILLVQCTSFLSADSYEVQDYKIEFIGLETRSPEELIDFIKAYSSPGEFHPCAATLINKMGFSDAACHLYFNDGQKYIVVKVVEKQYADNVRFLSENKDSMEMVKDYLPIREYVQKSNRYVQAAIMAYPYYLNGAADTVELFLKWFGLEENDLAPIFGFMADHNRRQDYRTAVQHLKYDRNTENLMPAMLLLMNFPEKDQTWKIFLPYLRYPDPKMRALAGNILETLMKDEVPRINWRSEKKSIYYLLNGTNYFSYDNVLSLLRQSGVNKGLIKRMLPDIKNPMISHLNVEYEPVKAEVISFLRYLSSLEEGTEAELEEWISSSQTLSPKLYPSPDLAIEYHSKWTKITYPKRIEVFKKNPLKQGDIVFLGNSITQQGGDWNARFGRHDMMNRGISGDVTDGVLARLGEICYAKPKAVFILIGINDIYNWNLNWGIPSPEYVGNNIPRIAQEIHRKSPKTKIYVQTVLPTDLEAVKDAIITVNKIIKLHEAKGHYQVIDLYSEFVAPNGLIKPELTRDGIHLTVEGYALWVGLLEEILDDER